MLQQPVLILALLAALVMVGEWLATKRVFKIIGSVILIIGGGALLSNTGLLPPGTAPTLAYDIILTYLAPLGIFYLLLDVNLSDLKKAGLPMLGMFAIGAAATIAGVLVGYSIWQPQEHGVASAPIVAGMYTGTYIGGSINLNAIALHYNMAKDGNLFAMVNAVDNLIGTPWILATLLLPRILHRILPQKPLTNGAGITDASTNVESRPLPATVAELALLLFLGLATLAIANLLSTYFPALPSIISITSIALILAQFPFVKKLKGSRVIGMFFLLLFLAVVGTFCNLQAVSNSGEATLIVILWVATIILIHGLIVFALGGILKVNWDIVAVASNANIGGSISAPICAAAINRSDLQVPGILVGSLGNAVGTYLGFWVVELVQRGWIG